MPTLWYLQFKRVGEVVGVLYVWATSWEAALQEAAHLSVECEGCTVAGAPPPEPEVIACLPTGFVGRWLTVEEDADAQRALARAWEERERAFRAAC